jgi:hypothetical protein
MIRPSSLFLRLIIITLSLGCLCTRGGAALAFERMDLSDGRRLTNVVVKSYDAEKGRLLLVTSGEAMVVSLDAVPEPYRSQLKEEAPKAGSSTITVPAMRVNAVDFRPLPTDARAPGSDIRPANGPEAHKAAALERAQSYYRFEYQAGSGATKVTALNFETDEPEPVDNWTGRYRTQGRVLLEYLDSKGYSFNRTTDRFEIITEQKDKGPIKVVDFTRK